MFRGGATISSNVYGISGVRVSSYNFTFYNALYTSYIGASLATLLTNCYTGNPILKSIQ